MFKSLSRKIKDMGFTLVKCTATSEMYTRFIPEDYNPDGGFTHVVSIIYKKNEDTCWLWSYEKASESNLYGVYSIKLTSEECRLFTKQMQKVLRKGRKFNAAKLRFAHGDATK